MADQRRFVFSVGFIMSLCTFELKQTLMDRMALKLRIHALRNYLKLTCEYELHILPNKKVSAAKGHGQNYIKG